MANLPTYETIGITAAWLVILCRALQSISSLGEIVGAELYLTETIKPPLQYPAVSSILVAGCFGSIAALVIAGLVTITDFSWRAAFWWGAIIALIGSKARTHLRETPDFIHMKLQMIGVAWQERELLKQSKETGLGKIATLVARMHPLWQIRFNKSALAWFFLVSCGTPLSFYFIYVYCAGIMQNKFAFTAAQVIHQNLFAIIIDTLAAVLYATLSYKIHPLRILKFRALGCFVFMLCLPCMLANITTATQLLIIQGLAALFRLDHMPAASVLYSHFPVFRRFTCVSWAFAMSRALMYIIISFGLVYLIEAFGYWGLWVIALPVCAGFYFGVRHFDRLEHPTKEAAQKPAWKLSPNQRAA
jgi:MFS family permease